jgi:feruloyl esterase
VNRFQQRGGKLLLYHGWSDANFSALSTIDYYERMRAVTGAERTGEWARLFLAPGMGHCGARPLCPYPQVATYNGTGSIDEAESFTCRFP